MSEWERPIEALSSSGVKELRRLQAENAKLREELELWHRLTAGIELSEYRTTQFQPCEHFEPNPWKELASGGVATESYICPSEEGSVCPAPRASVTFEGQKFTFDAEDSERFAKLLEGHLRKLAGIEVDE